MTEPAFPRAARRLRYRRPAAAWVEALPLGNGRLGAMVWGGAGEERLQLNEETLWSGEPGDDGPAAGTTEEEARRLVAAGDHAGADRLIAERWLKRRVFECYQPVGELRLAFAEGGAEEGYRRELDLATGVAEIGCRIGQAACLRTAFASHPANVLVYRVEMSGDARLSFTAAFQSPHPVRTAATGPNQIGLFGKAPATAVRRPPRQIAEFGTRDRYPELFAADGTPRPGTGPIRYEPGPDGRGMRFAAHLTVAECDGRVETADGGLVVRDATSATLLVTVATSFNGSDRSPSRDGIDEAALSARRAAEAAAVGFAALRRDHVADFRALSGRVDVALGPEEAADDPGTMTDERLARAAERDDPGLAELYFHFARYLLISASRPGTQAMNLQGLWCEERLPPWGCGYTLNINLQMNYWPAEVANLAECHRPLFALIRELAGPGRRLAASMYRRPGWVCHHSTTLWRECHPSDGSPCWAFWPMAAGWLCQHLWTHWEFSRDEAFLRDEAYPLMKGAAEFYAAWLAEDGEGHLTTPLGTSPENSFLSARGDGAAQAAAVSAGPTMDLAIVRECLLQAAAAAAVLGVDPAFRETAAAIVPRLAPYRIGKDGRLREWSRDFAETEPDHRHLSLLYGLHPGGHLTPGTEPELCAAARAVLERRGDDSTGWSTAWKINLWARLGDGERAHRLLRRLLRPGLTYPNLFDAHPPFQIDGNFGGAAGIAEMLLQSHDGAVHLLPALPRAWRDGAFRGFRARGGFEIALAWRDGVLRRAEVASRAGGPCRLRYGPREHRFPTAPGGRYAFDGELRPLDAEGPAAVMPPPRPRS